MKAVVFLQARTNSSRLPAKVLLPISGFPLVVLAAKRAGNTGLPVTVLTSTESTDDYLCDILQEYNVPFFRGNLNNTLERFVSALERVPDETIVVRLTADNVFPDGVFIDKLISEFVDSSSDYLICNSEGTELPYGLSAEITMCEHLREAYRSTVDSYDLEHVTPWISRKFGINGVKCFGPYNMANYRCTIDVLEDYLLLADVFKRVENPISASIDVLLTHLVDVSKDIIVANKPKKMVLGSAQLGMSYGIANKEGKPSKEVAIEILKKALANGISAIDTARSYGDSEELIGEVLVSRHTGQTKTITKISTLDNFTKDTSVHEVNAAIEHSIFTSLKNLRHTPDYFLLHRAEHISIWGQSLLDLIYRLKNNGLKAEFGVSVQTPEEAHMVLSLPIFTLLQFPYNLLDHRWDSVIERIIDVKNNRKLVVHARSALLQGLLNSKDTKLWSKANCECGEIIINWLQCKADELTLGSIPALCIKYVQSQNWIDGVVVGVDNIDQLNDNLNIFASKFFTLEQLLMLREDAPKLNDITLNPAHWKT